jgi:cardiolipin synthase
MQRRSAAATLAWLMVLGFLPVIGFVIWRAIGPQRLNRRKLKRAVGRRAVEAALVGLSEARESAPEHVRLALVPIGSGEAPPLAATGIVAYTDGRATFAAIFEAIRAAKHHVHLEYYIWEPDTIGTRLRDLLIERAKAGLEIRMIVDGTGSSKLKKKWLKPLRAAGVEFAWFNPITVRALRRRRRADFRTHRKIVVCDGVVGFTGGININDGATEELNPVYARDTHVKFEGKAVAAMQRAFLEDWYYTTEQIPKLTPAYFPVIAEPADPDADATDAVQVVSSGPDTDVFAIHKTFFAAVASAKTRAWLTTPYFIPDESIAMVLCAAALQRVDVRLIVPLKGDSRLVDLAARSYFEQMLRCGVRIYEYEPRFIHAKTMVIDDEVAIIGTANLDYRSFRLNFELIAVIYGKRVATRLAQAYVEDLASSREVTLSELAVLGFWTRLGQASARLMSPLL